MGSAVEWNAEISYVLTLYKYLLGILGLWVLDEENIFSRIRWFMSTIIEVSDFIIIVIYIELYFIILIIIYFLVCV